MKFIAHDFWSGVYIIALIIAGCVTIKGRNTDERRILYVMAANWMATRTFVSLSAPSTFFFAADVLSMIALIVFGKTDASKVCALFFFGIVSVGIAFDEGLIAYSNVTVWWDILSFAIMLIMAGAANDFWTGKRVRFAGVWRHRNSSGHSLLAVRRNATKSPSVVDLEN
jgi:hypothetical protein